MQGVRLLFNWFIVRKKQNEHRSAFKDKRDVEKTYGAVTKLEIPESQPKSQYETELKKQLYQNLVSEQVEAFEFVSKTRKTNLLRIMQQVAFLQRGLSQQERATSTHSKER
ncbi:hypothetical protein CW304_11935 [Bacillus sp. UFRGS-B20]|nr:hypothetical protein CW304_11935 [Bacillus sp. UFRGS-B20]